MDELVDEEVTFRGQDVGECTGRDDSTFREPSLEERIMEKLDKLSLELHKDVSSVQNNMVVCIRDFQNQIEMIHRNMEKYENQNSNQNRNTFVRDEPNFMEGPRRGHLDSTPREQDYQNLRRNETFNTGSLVKIKPQTYNGLEDWDEYLTQFNILSDLNGWSYYHKSLYLASSLTGSARSLLNELDERKRRDFDCLVVALNNRFGSDNKAEIFRSTLQNRVRGKDESLPELAQSIRMMTRKAYSRATSEVIDVIALDYFIDAIPDMDIRMRLREVGPKNIDGAVQVAVRLETHRLADRQRGKFVRHVDEETNKNAPVERQFQKINDTLQNLVRDVREIKSKPVGAQNGIGRVNGRQYPQHGFSRNFGERQDRWPNTSNRDLHRNVDLNRSPSGAVQGIPMTLLVDTGASVSILRREVIESWPIVSQPKIYPVKMQMVTVTGDKSLFYGKASVQIILGSETTVLLLQQNKTEVVDGNQEKLPEHLKDLFERSTKNLAHSQKLQVKKLLEKYQQAFSKNSGDIGHTTLVEHKIDVGDTQPIKQHPYRIPLAKREQAEQEIDEMAKKNIIEPSDSPWCSPIIMVPKGEGFTVMPFGLCNAPATFERLMEKVLTGLTWRLCLVYLDDIIIYSKNFEEHISNLSEVLQRLMEANLKLSPEKCTLLQREVTFLGHVVSEHGISTDPRKTEAVRNWVVPRNVKEVRSFLGLCSYYRKHVCQFASIAKPLHQLTEKGRDFHWTNECQKAFEKLKTALISSPILSYPQPEGKLILDTDASGVAMGSVLSQIQEGKEKVLGYYSTCFSKSERRYCVTRRELLAVINAVKHFHHYLYGRHFLVRSDHGALRWLLNFKIPEGQMARWLEILSSYDYTIEHRAGRVHSNADILSRRPCDEVICDPQTFTMDNVEKDSPSIRVGTLKTMEMRTCKTQNKLEVDISDLCSEKLIEYQKSNPTLKLLRDWKMVNKKPEWSEIASYGPELKYYWYRWQTLHLKNDILYRCWECDDGKNIEWQTVLPKALTPYVLGQLHDSPTGGHLGIKKTLCKVRRRFFWHGLRKDVENWCRKCDTCAARKMPLRKAKAPMKQYNVGAPLERIAIDIMGPLPKSRRGCKYLMVVADYFTKWTMAFPIRNQEAVTVAQKLVDEFVSLFGVPLQIHSDQGSNFESQVFREMCKVLGIEKTRTTAMRPQSDGMIERANRTIESILASFVSKHQKDWDEYIPLLMMAYRSSIHESTSVSPNKMMFGREINLPIDLVFGRPEKELQNSETEYACDLEENLTIIHDFARKRLQLSSDAMKKNYDHKVKHNQYNQGDLVWYYNPQREVGKNPKLQKPWVGPCGILEKLNDILYRIKPGPRSKTKVVHHDRLKPYLGNKE
ncbi:hypothetical protein ScPMuIL_017524, partial [Solemya velum]